MFASHSDLVRLGCRKAFFLELGVGKAVSVKEVKQVCVQDSE